MNKDPKILIACEFSGTIREQFRDLGYDAWSCDLLPDESKTKRFHIQGNVLDILEDGWDLMIAHPPCTYLCSSGERWMTDPAYPERAQQREDAADFFMEIYHAPIPRIAVENPIGVMSTRFRKPDQIAQPWMFGHKEVKSTCFWLKNLPPLKPTRIIRATRNRKHYKGPSEDRWKFRSLTYIGMAKAMADQWGEVLDKEWYEGY